MLKPHDERLAVANFLAQPLSCSVEMQPMGKGGMFLVERMLALDPAPLISAESLQEERELRRHSSCEPRERDLMQEEMRVAMVGHRAVGAYAIDGICYRDQSSFIEAPATLRFLAVDPEYYSHDLVGEMVRDAVKIAHRWSHDHIAVNLSGACSQKFEALKAAGFRPAPENAGDSDEQNWYFLDLLSARA